MDYYQLKREMEGRLEPDYGAGEAKAMVRLILHHLKGWDQTQLMIHGDETVSDAMLRKAGEILDRLERHEPLQYILGEARFYGMDLTVNRSVLIPRPETEELVDIIVRENPGDDLRVLDVGTGSGAIAIALSRNLPFSQITAIDFSEGALAVARENATRLHADVKFVLRDIFRYEPQPESFDIIVSNPPYIVESERKSMDANVLDYEPESALFVPDSHPLLFYSRIAEVALKGLASGGRLYFEINPLFAADLKKMLQREGFDDVTIAKDISGRERFASAVKGNNN